MRISAETLGFHHGKHHGGYVRELNAAIAGTELEALVARGPATGVFNNAAQPFNLVGTGELAPRRAQLRRLIPTPTPLRRATAGRLADLRRLE